MSKPKEIKALSGARAIPPLILVLYHFCEGHAYRGNFWFDVPVAKGYLWVEFFFALSGFILVHVYGPRAAEFWRGQTTYFDFLKARLSRLYPLHLFMLFAILGLVVALRALAWWGGYLSIYDVPYHAVVSASTFIANLFLVQAWNICSSLSWNGAAWFVSVEFLLCLLFPLYAVLSRGGFGRALMLIAAGLVTLNYMASTSGHGLDITFHNGIFRGMAGFAIGVGLSMLYERALARGADKLPEVLFSLAQTASVILLLLAIYRTGWSHKPADIYVALALYPLIFTLAFDRGVLARLLSTKPILKLGEWSFAIYIGQTFFLQLLRYAEQRLYPPPDTIVFGMRWADLIWWPEPLVLLTCCVIWGALLATFIEQPANAWLRKRFGQSRSG